MLYRMFVTKLGPTQRTAREPQQRCQPHTCKSQIRQHQYEERKQLDILEPSVYRVLKESSIVCYIVRGRTS